MNELLKRSITGILYVFLLLTAIMLSNAEAFGFLFLVFGLICLYEFKRLVASPVVPSTWLFCACGGASII